MVAQPHNRIKNHGPLNKLVASGEDRGEEKGRTKLSLISHCRSMKLKIVTFSSRPKTTVDNILE